MENGLPCWKIKPLAKYIASNSLKEPLAIIIGTVFQWFDFSLYSCLSGKLASSFYPVSLPYSLSILMIWISFAVGWLFAPIGGIVFGYIGDIYGRKNALTLSIILMSSASLMITILPTFQIIGVWAPIFLLVSRSLQGLSSSAEYNGATIYLIERAPKHLKTFAGCLPNICNSAGMILGFLAGEVFSKNNLPAWSWRIPFLFSFIGLISAYKLRCKIEEEENNIFLSIKKKLSNNLKQVKKIIFIIVLAAYNGVTSWGIYLWLSVLLKYFYISNEQATIVVLLGLILDIMFEPLAGLLTKYIPEKKIFLIFSFLFFIILYPALKLFQQGDFYLDLIVMTLITFFLSSATAMINKIVVQSIDKEIRYIFLGSFWNIGMTLFGGTTPVILSLFLHWTNKNKLILISGYINFFVLIAFLAVKNHDRK